MGDENARALEKTGRVDSYRRGNRDHGAGSPAQPHPAGDRRSAGRSRSTPGSDAHADPADCGPRPVHRVMSIGAHPTLLASSTLSIDIAIDVTCRDGDIYRTFRRSVPVIG